MIKIEKIEYPNLGTYRGETQKTFRHGKGTMTWLDGRKYVGGWKNNSRHGRGTYTHPNGTKYVGGWNNGHYHGQGSMSYANGDKYKGNFKKGSYHGQGTKIYSNGSKQKGEWFEGNFVGKDNKKLRSLKFPKPYQRIGDLFYRVYSEYGEEEAVQYNHQKNIDNGFLELEPFYYMEDWRNKADKYYDKELDLSPLTQFQDIRSLCLSQMGYIKDFSPLQKLKNLETLEIKYDLEWHYDVLGGESNKIPNHIFSSLPLLEKLKKFEYDLQIYDTKTLEAIVQNMPNLESINLTTSSGYTLIPEEHFDFDDPDDYELNEELNVELSTLLDLKKLKHLKILFTNSIREWDYSFFRALGETKIPLRTLRIIERNWSKEITSWHPINRTDVIDNLFEISKVKTLEELHLDLHDQHRASWEVTPTGTKRNDFKIFGFDFLKALSTLPNLKKLDGNWMAWFEKHKWKDLNEQNKMKSLRHEAIKQCARLEHVNELPEMSDNSIFKKMTSLKKIGGDVIITNCANLKETCSYLQNIDIGNLHLTIQDKTAVDFEELSKLISIRNKSGLYQLTVIFPFKQLKSLRGIEKLRRLSHLNVWGLGDDIDLEPLCNLTKLDEVTLTGSLYKNRRKILNRHNTGMLTVLKNYSTYDYKTKKYKTTNAIKIKDYSKDEYRFKRIDGTQEEAEKTDWEFLGECYLPGGSPLGIIDPEHLPLDAKPFDAKEHEWDEIEKYFDKHGAGSIGFQENVIYAKIDQFSNIKELRIVEGGSIYFGGQSDTPVIYGRADTYTNYFRVEKAFYDSVADENALKENRFKIKTNRIASFEIHSNKMIIFDHKNWGPDEKFANVLKKKPIDNKITFIEDKNKFRSGNIPNVVKIESHFPDYLINCENGTYDVFSIEGECKAKVLKAKDVHIKFSCCSQTKTFHKDLIVRKMYGRKKGNPIDYFYCDKCDKLIGGFNEEIRDLMFDAKGEKINFNEYSLEGYNYQPYKDNFFCYAIRLRENNNQDMKLGFESPLLK